MDVVLMCVMSRGVGWKSKFDGSIDELDEEGKEKTQNVTGETLFYTHRRPLSY